MLDEYLTGIRPYAAQNLEIDAVIRAGNNVGVMEVKRKASKTGIDQLTTAANREYLGTYVKKVLVSSAKVPRTTRKLAREQGIIVIELPSFLEQGRLSDNDVAKLRATVRKIMLAPVQTAR